MEIIEADGFVKSNKEPLKSITPKLETDEMCEIGLMLKLKREDYLRLVRSKNLNQAIVVKVGIPQEELDLEPTMEGMGEATVSKNGAVDATSLAVVESS